MKKIIKEKNRFNGKKTIFVKLIHIIIYNKKFVF